MKRPFFLTSSLVILSLCILTSTSHAQDKTTKPAASQPSRANPEAATKKSEPAKPKTAATKKADAKPAKSTTGEVRVYAPLPPVNYFSQGWEHYRKGEFASASMEMKKAASMLEISASWSTGNTKEGLDHASRDLMDIATQLDKESENIKLDDLRHAIAEAHVALADFNLHRAQTGMSKLENREVNLAGHHLAAAAQNLRIAADWSGKKLGKGTREVLRGVDAKGNKLITEQRYEITDPDKEMKNFALEIAKFADELDAATPAKVQAR